MQKHKGTSVEKILGSLDPEKRGLAEKLRSLVREVLPEIVETVKWGNITYLLKGKNIAWILFYEDHVDFGFFRGAELESKLLEGTGKNLRHIKIRTSSELDETEITRLLKKAAKLETGQ